MFNANAGQSSSPLNAYSQLGAEALPQVAQVFLQHFQQIPGPQAQQYAQLSPNSVTPAVLAEMHQFAAQNHAGILGQIMQHPQVAAALGGFAERELGNILGGNQRANNQGLGGFRL